jgi:hypothetical protein
MENQRKTSQTNCPAAKKQNLGLTQTKQKIATQFQFPEAQARLPALALRAAKFVTSKWLGEHPRQVDY